ncbi:MAG: helix-turn-helix domain-containing protein, partial [Chlamydiia bacterium]|nr:helix-turn-helix domain-containing protein [Chlamydiia bacterium]
SSGMNKPYYRVSEGMEKGTYIRLGRSTIRANLDMIEELKWRTRGKSYDELPVYQAQEADLDYKALSRFLESRKGRPPIAVSTEVLKSYHILVEEHGQIYPTVAGILLFGKKPSRWFSESMIICTHFSGTKGREALATRDCTGTLFEQFHESFEFILSRLNRSFTIQGPQREEKLEIPEIAIREFLLNAVIHRNYHLNAPTKIAIWADRVEIFSPGNFPTPLPNLELGLTDVRNKMICNIFREANYIEKLGTGFITAFESYREANLPHPEVIDGENFVKCILPRESYGIAEESDELQPILRLFLAADSLSVSDVIHQLQIPRATAARRLAKLVEMGLLIQIGKGKGTKYCKP